jgi:hypothetical protein
MKFFTDIVLQGVAKLKAPFIQLTPVGNATTEMNAARGALYIDVNATNDSATDYDGSVVQSVVQKQSLKFNLNPGTEASTADWRDVLSSYDFPGETEYKGINGSTIAAATGAIRRTNVFGGRLINLNLSPRFQSEATSKAYVDSKSSFFGSYTFTGTTSALTYTKSSPLNLPRPGIVVTVYQITDTTATTQTREVVYPDISITRSGSGTVALPYLYNITLSFASAPGAVEFLVAYNC